jgi:hypothetical protein
MISYGYSNLEEEFLSSLPIIRYGYPQVSNLEEGFLSLLPIISYGYPPVSNLEEGFLSLLPIISYGYPPFSNLEEGFLGEELPQDASTGPDINSWSIAFLSQQQLGWPIPKRDHL